MIWIDFTLVGVIFIYFVTGLLRGFTKEVFSLAFWMLAIWVSLMFSHDFSVFLEPTFNQVPVRMIASFVALFAITLSFGSLIGVLLTILSKNTGLTFMEHFGGMIFGAVRGLIVVTVLVILAGLTPLPKDSWWTESILIPPFQLLAVWLRDHFSSGMAEYIIYR